MNNNALQKILFAIGFVSLAYILSLFRCCDQSIPVTPVKPLIEKTKDLKKQTEPIRKEIEIQKIELIKWKTLRDTVKIIEIQDSIIYKQGEVIVKLDTIIQIQDSIIYIQSEDLKSVKKSLRKQKLKTIGVGIVGAVGIVGTVLILK